MITQHYSYMVPNSFVVALCILHSCLSNKCLDKTALSKSILPRDAYKTSLDTSRPPKLLSLHCRQINRVKTELDGNPSKLLACMQVLYKAAFTPMHLVFVEVDIHNCHLGFKRLVEKKNVIIWRTKNKPNEYIR